MDVVYVQLLGEGKIVYRPAPVEVVGPDTVRLLAPPGYDPENEDGEFNPGSLVRVGLKTFSGGAVEYVAIAGA